MVRGGGFCESRLGRNLFGQVQSVPSGRSPLRLSVKPMFEDRVFQGTIRVALRFRATLTVEGTPPKLPSWPILNPPLH